ncbi:neo-calmodulin-like [Crassostrea virginica]|uniref:Sulfhydryl light chain n=1 Tax=Crassostrea virginica TaxID=6565 RepID=A0A8B8AGD1_CRAVI|nr:calmodulin-A-like [Crassostrea virginica]
MPHISETEMDKEVSEIRKSFDYVDENKNGRVLIKDLTRGFHIIGFDPTSKEAIDVVTELNTEGGAYVDFERYEKVVKKVLRKTESEQRFYQKAFRRFDKNGDGSVSYEELKEVFLARGKSEKDVKDFFDEADTDKDGQVDYEEFVMWFSRT